MSRAVPKTLAAIGGWAKQAVAESPQLKRGRVWCTVCGRSERVDSVVCLGSGWPKCCGYTMSLSSPKERAAFAAKEKRS